MKFYNPIVVQRFKAFVMFGVLLMTVFSCSLASAADIRLSLVELNLTPEEQAWLKANKTVRIGGPKAFAPFHYYDEQGKLKGISADYIFTIMNQLGLTMDVQEKMPWNEVLERIKSGQIDLIPCIAKNKDREAFLSFSLPYLSFPLVILSRKDAPFIGGVEDLHGKRIAVIKKNVVSDWLEK